jgi:branched-chain amino acid aminotransferase
MADVIPFDDRDGSLWFDGKMVPWREAKIHVLTHGLHYASCVFEGERMYNGRIYKLHEHTDRLFKSAEIMGMKIPFTVEEINKGCIEACAALNVTDAYVRPVVYRGSEMMSVAAQAKGYHDALMFDYRGYLAEATGANAFFVQDGKIHTPIADCFLNGITRKSIIALALARQIPVVERHIKPEELAGFDECFLTGSAAEVTPVSEIGPYKFKPGQICETMLNAYADEVRSAVSSVDLKSVA